jgi:hypothetical protein
MSTNINNTYYVAGNVGIGTNDPVYPLDVNGCVRISGNADINGNVNILDRLIVTQGISYSTNLNQSTSAIIETLSLPVPIPQFINIGNLTTVGNITINMPLIGSTLSGSSVPTGTEVTFRRTSPVITGSIFIQGSTSGQKVYDYYNNVIEDPVAMMPDDAGNTNTYSVTIVSLSPDGENYNWYQV